LLCRVNRSHKDTGYDMRTGYVMGNDGRSLWNLTFKKMKVTLKRNLNLTLSKVYIIIPQVWTCKSRSSLIVLGENPDKPDSAFKTSQNVDFLFTNKQPIRIQIISFVGFRCWYKPSLNGKTFIIILLLLAWHQSQRQGGPLLENNKFKFF